MKTVIALVVVYVLAIVFWAGYALGMKKGYTKGFIDTYNYFVERSEETKESV